MIAVLSACITEYFRHRLLSLHFQEALLEGIREDECLFANTKGDTDVFLRFVNLGDRSLPYKQFLGYEKGPDDLPQIVEEQAEIVRRIYSMFMFGKTTSAIAKQLTREGIPTPAGKAYAVQYIHSEV